MVAEAPFLLGTVFTAVALFTAGVQITGPFSRTRALGLNIHREGSRSWLVESHADLRRSPPDAPDQIIHKLQAALLCSLLVTGCKDPICSQYKHRRCPNLNEHALEDSLKLGLSNLPRADAVALRERLLMLHNSPASLLVHSDLMEGTRHRHFVALDF